MPPSGHNVSNLWHLVVLLNNIGYSLGAISKPTNVRTSCNRDKLLEYIDVYLWHLGKEITKLYKTHVLFKIYRSLQMNTLALLQLFASIGSISLNDLILMILIYVIE